MDVKFSFLNGYLEEEFYIEKLEGFILTFDEGFICRLKKALYGRKQDPKIWYERLEKYLQQQGFKKGIIDNKLYVKSEGDHLLIVVVYIDDIIFGSDMEQMGHQFAKMYANRILNVHD